MRRQPTHEERFADLFRSTYPLVLAFVRRRYPTDAEAVVAEAFTIAWHKVATIPRDPEQAKAWLFQTARNCLLNTLRAERRRDALGVRVAEGFTHATLEADAVARLDFARAWNQLPDDAQEALALAHFDGLTSEQAGRVLGISAVAFRARLSRARRSLDRLLLPEHIEADAPTTRGALR